MILHRVRALVARLFPERKQIALCQHPAYEIVFYTRTSGCPFVTTAKQVLHAEQLPYREVFIDKDSIARSYVQTRTGFLSVPTLVCVSRETSLPISEPQPLEPDASPRGINRGAMITEPNPDQLRVWLSQHGFIE